MNSLNNNIALWILRYAQCLVCDLYFTGLQSWQIVMLQMYKLT